MSHQLISVPIIKPVDALCNLSCSYCYVSGLRDCNVKNRMQPEILKAVIDFFCHDQDDVEFIWHGGEPLLAGLCFYQKAVELQYVWRQKGKRIENFIQTNATLLTTEWIRLFAGNNFLVGVSLDGPKEFHDQVRRYSDKKGSYDDVMEGINLLRNEGIFNGVICGISAINHEFPREIFNFFLEKGMKKLKFARVKDTGDCGDVSSLAISPTQYTDFMIAIFDLWLEADDQEVEIRDIQSVVDLMLGGNKRECIYTGQCGRFATIYSDGSIYGCDSFSKTDAVYFGSILDEPAIVRSNSNLRIFQETIRKRRSYCHNCNWHFICKGGCASDGYERLDSIEPLDDACKNRKRYFEHISTKIRSYGLM